ncbi:MAG: hypothetical protein L0Z49_09280 [Actinobacteria bacterium]|nr:hypothetical protein [Actinomycetota bacterium]MCI0679029.1 hypothetical protein [Actinomycetota bacterium]
MALTDSERFLLVNRLGWGGARIMSQEEIGVMLGVSQVTVSNLEQTLRNKLKRSIRTREKNEAAAKAHVSAMGVLYAVFEETVGNLGLDIEEVSRAAERHREQVRQGEGLATSGDTVA